MISVCDKFLYSLALLPCTDEAAKPLSPSEEKTLEISSPVSEENKLDKLEESVVTDVKHDQEENEAIEVKDAWDEESQEEDSSEEEEEETGNYMQ